MNQSEASSYFAAMETNVMLAELVNFHLYQFASDFSAMKTDVVLSECLAVRTSAVVSNAFRFWSDPNLG